jgi:hypothetical protein
MSPIELPREKAQKIFKFNNYFFDNILPVVVCLQHRGRSAGRFIFKFLWRFGCCR